MPPMTRSRAGKGNTPTDLMATYYRQRSTAGLIITEGTQISPQGQGYVWTPGIHSPEQIEGWKKITNAVHQAGGIIFAQLWHVGRLSHTSFQPGRQAPVSSSALIAEGVKVFIDPAGQGAEQGKGELVQHAAPRALTILEIKEIINDFIQAAQNAMDAGFDGVELHGANGYLINQFLDSEANNRTDEYGGTLENRLRFLKNVTEGVSEKIGKDKVGVRLAPLTTLNGAVDRNPEETYLAAVKALQKIGILYLHIAEADWDDAPLMPLPFKQSLRSAFTGQIIYSGSYDQERANNALEQGWADLIGFGRPFIANPDLPYRLQFNLPLNEVIPDTYFGGTARGYTDYPYITQEVTSRHNKESVALVVGAQGVIGRNLVEHLSSLGNWKIIGLSRRGGQPSDRVDYVAVDLMDKNDCLEKLSSLHQVTHIFYAAYQDRPTWAELVEPNLKMLVNVVETMEKIAPGLKHISLMQGYKVYGAHLGPFKTPAKETDAGPMPPEFNIDQQQFLEQQQQGKSWAWSAIRPSVVGGVALGNPMNLAMVIAIYASISKELGLPLRFPGKPGAYDKLLEMTDASLLANATVWAATDKRAVNQAFNINNGDLFRWSGLWPKIAAYFNMETATPMPMSLSVVMADKEALWNKIINKYGLHNNSYSAVSSWPFGDFVFSWDYDFFADGMKARQMGFHEYVDTEQMFYRIFDDLRAQKIIPDFKS